jgi:type II secretion system protein G
MKKENNKKRGHSRVFLSGISLFGAVYQIREKLLCLTKTEKAGVPRTLRAATSGMTTIFKRGPELQPFRTTSFFISSPLAGEGARRAGEGETIKKSLFNSLIRAASTFSHTGRRNFGFTLIELLVVVLIIGILAAIALPQYQVSVAKTRFQQLKVAADALYKAQQVYYLTNGSYPTDFESLDISLGEPTSTEINPVEGYGYKTIVRYHWGNCSFDSYSNRIQCSSSYKNVPTYTTFGGRDRRCIVDPSNTIKKQVCASETNATPTTYDIYWDYQYP